MGLTAYVCVWTSGPPDPTDRFVLLALTSFLNDNREDMEVWPGIPRLSQMTSLGATTIKRSIRRLRKDGWLSVIQEPNSGRRTNTYQIHFSPLPATERDAVKGMTTSKRQLSHDPEGPQRPGRSGPVPGRNDPSGGPQRPLDEGRSGRGGGPQRPPNKNRTGELNWKGTGSGPDAAQVEGQDQGEQTEGVSSSVVIPDDSDVLTFSRAWPGDLAMGAPPGIPDAWAMDWIDFQFKKRKFPVQWQRALVNDFKRDFRGRVAKALPGYRSSRSRDTAPVEPIPDWLASAAAEVLR